MDKLNESLVPGRVGIIGLGQVGVHVAGRLSRLGIPIRVLDSRPTEHRSRRYSPPAGVPVDADVASFGELIDVVFVTTTGTTALGVALDVVPLLPSGRSYVDFTSKSLETRDAIADACRSAQVDFVDAAVLAGVAGSESPLRIAVSGSRAEAIARLLPLPAFDCRVLGTVPCTAEVRLCQSVFAKGMTMLLLETLLTAQRLGIRETVNETLNDLLAGGLEPLARASLVSTLEHAPRRASEAAQARALVRRIIGSSPMSDATTGVLERVAEACPREPGVRVTVDAVLRLVEDCGVFESEG